MSCKIKGFEVGKMRHKVSFQHPTLIQDSIGGSTTTYATYQDAWVELTPAKASQKWQAQQLSLRVSHKIKCRYFDGLKSDDRVLFGSRIFEVQEIINAEERNIYYELVLNEGDAS